MSDVTLAELMAGDGESMPVETTPEVQQEQQPEPSQTRDEHGRFATKAEEQPVSEQTEVQQQPETHAENGKGIPVKAVQEEREKRQAAQAESAELQRKLAELQGQMSVLMQQRQPVQQPQQEQQPASIWDDPDSYLKSQMTPVQQQMADMREFMSENLAIQAHGAETVNAAKAAIEQAARTPDGQQVIARLMQSRHPFEELVQWHKRQTTLSMVGNDPQAWFQQEFERKMADPAFMAQVMEKTRTAATANVNRSQPVTNIPPSLSRLPGGTNAAEDSDMSDAALFAHARR